MTTNGPFLATTPVKITDTTLRDGHQSTLATRLRTEDMLPIAAELDDVGFYSVEVWGGATFDVATRFLNEDPWERVRLLKQRMPRTPFQMLLRGQNLVGYRHYPDDVVRAFIEHAAEVGIDIFRVFDAVNDERNFEVPFEAIKRAGKHIQGTICYSITERRLGGPVYNIDYFVQKALILQDMGADSICLKDMAGLISPYDAYELVKALKAVLRVPLQLHTHYTSGMACMAALKAIEAGIDIVDTALAPFALRSSQPAVEPLLAALYQTPRDPGLDLPLILKLGQYFETIAPKYRDFLDTTKMSIIDTGVLIHQIPGGMLSNLVAQLREADALDRIDAVYEELPRVRQELGYAPLVTPTSQIIGIQAVQNVLFGRYTLISKEVKDYLYGLYGKPPAAVDRDLQRRALTGYDRGEEPITVRPADILEPELEQAKAATAELARDTGDVLVYALYPTTGLRFLRWKYGLEPVPPEVKPKTLEDVRREDEAVAKAKAGQLVEPPPTPVTGAGALTFNVCGAGQHYEVTVEATDGGPALTSAPRRSAAAPVRPAPAGAAATTPRPAASPAPAAPHLAEGEVAITAPMPGVVIRYEVAVGQEVRAGSPVVILEAMKMQNALPAPVDGVVKALAAEPGARVARNDVLAVIARS
ncbi:MAG: pyruvate carboxylase subunit B [Chloroflexi bacterium]|nr:pyruvate carboxylase subunit B [Chloroflexota bacterium]